MKKTLLILSLILVANFAFSDTYSYIENLFEIRNSISEHDEALLPLLQKKDHNSIRTLERIFELNTSALTTIEAYFRIFKVAVAREGAFDKNTINILNEWLTFIKTQCHYDLEFIYEAVLNTESIEVLGHLQTSKKNIEVLNKIASDAIQQNDMLLAE